MKDIYFIEVVGKEQKDKRGPFTYQQFKRMYEEKSNDKLTYMSPVWNGNEISIWTQLYKTDIFEDIDPQRFNDLKNKKQTNSKSKTNNQSNNSSLAQPIPLKEYKDKEA